MILTGSWKVSESLQTWDVRTGALIDTIVAINRSHTIDGEFTYCVQFAASDDMGDTILSGTSGIGTLEVTSIAEKKVLTSFKVKKVIYTVDSYDERIIFGGMENEIKIAEFGVQ